MLNHKSLLVQFKIKNDLFKPVSHDSLIASLYEDVPHYQDTMKQMIDIN